MPQNKKDIVMRNTIELIIRVIIFLFFSYWTSLYASHVFDVSHNYLGFCGIFILMVLVVVSVYFKRHFSLSYGEWDNMICWIAIIFATIYNVIYWEEILAMQPQYIRMSATNIFTK